MALVIYNPVSGDSTAGAFFSEHVLPLLHQHDISIAPVLETRKEGEAGSVASEHFERTQGPLDIILGSGDGTLHEVISAISLPNLKTPSRIPARINFVLVPCGTANALFSSLFPVATGEDPTEYKLKGIYAYLRRSSSIPLTLAISSILPPPRNNEVRTPQKNAISAVVASTALHASILHDSESLRAELPSIDRFKVAARNNITRWYKSFAKLLPSQSSGLVEIYDPTLSSFVPHPRSIPGDPIVDLDGPFTYFLSTVNVDRLEPLFRITPLVSSYPRAGAFMDIVIIRPLRDPSVCIDSPETRAAFAAKLGAVLTAAYRDGDHVNLRYDSSGNITSEGDGATVVEYFRCGGWEWEPVCLTIETQRSNINCIVTG